MKVLDGREVADYLKERHVRQVRGLARLPRLAIVRQGATAATDMYLRVKQAYGDDIGVPVDIYTESPTTLLSRIEQLNADPAVTAINVELPFADAPDMTAQALGKVVLTKDVEGFAPGSTYEVVTPKAILWLLAAYNIEPKGKTVAIIGQGIVVGLPLANRLEASGSQVIRLDEASGPLGPQLTVADIIVSATGVPGVLTSAMIPEGAVVIDAGAPKSDLAEDVRTRKDLILTPNPGGVGPMTVAALFDNVLLGALSGRSE